MIYEPTFRTINMKTYAKEDLDAVLEKHGKWLRYQPGGELADLRYADLHSADLSSANLRSANLRSADLSSADLSYANLSYADLRYADLRDADLHSADLSSADLSYANLSYADLRYADLRSADLSSAKGTEKLLADVAFEICPTTGAFTGFKKAGLHIVTLEVPAEAQRVNAVGSRKCRVSKAKVIAIEPRVNISKVSEVCSNYDCNFGYRLGETVEVLDFDPSPIDECSRGIHLFITRKEAERY